MKLLTQFKTTIRSVRKPMGPVGPGFLILLLLTCFGRAPMAQAVGPDTDGAIPGSNNGEGIGVLVSRTGGVWNTGTGFEALSQLTAGNQNTATGLRALFSDTNGGFNTATGVLSLFSNTSGFFNSATGAYSLANNISGSSNTANGYAALWRNTADGNTATGFGALFKNTTGFDNTANGYQALFSNTIGTENTAVGDEALHDNTVGFRNTASGQDALFNNTTGADNTANGVAALALNTTGSSNIALGFLAGNGVTTANDVIAIGTSGANVSNSCFIGNIFGVTVGLSGIPVVIDSTGQLGTIVSSKRFKKEIQPMDKASEAILGLKPVTFHYKSDNTSTPQFGLIAEEVAEVNPDLVVRDDNGEIYTVRYDAVNAMLLNEFLKEHGTMQELKATVARQEATIAQQQKDFQSKLAEQQKAMEAVIARLNEQDSKIQKVNDQLELTKVAPQMVVNDQ